MQRFCVALQLLRDGFRFHHGRLRLFRGCLQLKAFGFIFADQFRQNVLREGTLPSDTPDNFCLQVGQLSGGFGVCSVHRRIVGLALGDFFLIAFGNKLAFGYTFHSGKNISDYLFHLFIQKMHGVAGRPITLGLLSCLSVTDITDTLGSIHQSAAKCIADKSRLVARMIERRSEYDIFVKDYLVRENGQRTRKYKTIWDAGYFSIDKKGKMTDSKLTDKKAGTSDDTDAYDLIMKNKELLLDRDPKRSPVRFIFSHSALREGWDNPNVFQICTLKQSSSEVRKRQEVGRGLRLCVNQEGERMDANVLGNDVHNINILTVITSTNL